MNIQGSTQQDIVFRLQVKTRTKNELIDVTGRSNAGITNALANLLKKNVIKKEGNFYNLI